MMSKPKRPKYIVTGNGIPEVNSEDLMRYLIESGEWKKWLEASKKLRIKTKIQS